MAMVAIAGQLGITLANSSLHADDDGLLPDVQMAETTDETHAVHLPRLLFKAAYQ